MILPGKNSDWVFGIGLMSGTSLDGVDIAYCKFRKFSEKWEFEIVHAETISYSADVLEMLRNMIFMPESELVEADRKLGSYYGILCKEFIERNSLEPQFISSHGHTIFHRPAEGYTFQAGNGSEIAKNAGVLCVNDFRSPDVDKGGQGAPLVPIGDKFLFSEYDALVNFGGISNISFEQNGQRIGFDICPVNMALNHFSEILGYSYDRNGEMASQGKIIPELLLELNNWSYYSKNPPKSLAREDFESDFLPLVLQYRKFLAQDILRTLTEHIAFQISNALIGFSNVLFTGGGAKNTFLVSLIRKKLGDTVHVPDSVITDFKEALIFAFMGLLRLRGEINVLAEVTGASSDTCSGAVSYPI